MKENKALDLSPGKNENILKHIIAYCEEINKKRQRFGNTYTDLCEDPDLFDGSCFYILQIGEIVKRLSNNITIEYNEIPWRDITGMRDYIAHNFVRMKTEIVWNVISKDIPELHKYCQYILNEI